MDPDLTPFTGEGGALPGQDPLRSVAIAGSGVEALGKPGLSVVQQRFGGREASSPAIGSSHAVDGLLVLSLDALLSALGQPDRVKHGSLGDRNLEVARCCWGDAVLAVDPAEPGLGLAGPADRRWRFSARESEESSQIPS